MPAKTAAKPATDVDPDDVRIDTDEPTITEVVNAAGDDSTSEAAQGAAYDDALDFFLADENDLEKNPLTDDAIVWRYDIEAEKDKALVAIPIRTIEDHELKALRARSKERGPGGIRTDETDDVRFYTLVCAEASNFDRQRQAALIQKHRTVEVAFRKMLLPGERIALGQHILAFSGFGATIQSKASAEVQAAKN